MGQRVFGLADWARDGSLAEYAAVEARVIGTGRAAGREAALGLGADAFVDLQAGWKKPARSTSCST